MQPNDLFSLSTLIDQIHQWSGPWMTALLPWLEFFLGITLAFIVGTGIVTWILHGFGHLFHTEKDEYGEPLVWTQESQRSYNEDVETAKLEGLPSPDKKDYWTYKHDKDLFN